MQIMFMKKNDMDDKELNDFENMTHDQFELVQEFFNTMPKVGVLSR